MNGMLNSEESGMEPIIEDVEEDRLFDNRRLSNGEDVLAKTATS